MGMKEGKRVDGGGEGLRGRSRKGNGGGKEEGRRGTGIEGTEYKEGWRRERGLGRGYVLGICCYSWNQNKN